MTTQIELGQNHRNFPTPKPAGYAQWASWIASDTDNEPFVFRKFDELGALNILYLQSEMLNIEAQLRQLDQEDVRQPDIESINATRHWEVLVAQCVPSELSDPESAITESKACIRARKRMELILKLRTKIKEYRKAAFSLQGYERLNLTVIQTRPSCSRAKSRSYKRPASAF